MGELQFEPLIFHDKKTKKSNKSLPASFYQKKIKAFKKQ